MNKKHIITNAVDRGWSEIEFAELYLGDARLEKRLCRVAEDLSKHPEYPINLASEDFAATTGAYRLFNNEKVTPERIFQPHKNQTLKRMQNEPVVLAIQDTSFFNFTGHKKTKGLGPIGDDKNKAQGLIIHSTFAVTPYGLPLGVLSHKCWAREGFRNMTKHEIEDLPIEEKESYKWIESLRETTKLTEKHKETQVITIADRECDIYEFLLAAQELNAPYVIRASKDRHLQSKEYTYLQELILHRAPQAQITLEVPSQKRKASLELRFSAVTLSPPDRISKSRKKFGIECWVVHMKEVSAPKGVEPLSWTLLTNVPVTTIAEAVERVEWYRRRWSIEEFHKILKSGCEVEDCRLQTADKLKRYLALFCVIGWRIFWMVHMRRTDPKAPAEVILTQSEIGSLRTLKRFKDLIPEGEKLTVKKALTAVACLGGYLNRKNDPPPGAIAFWRGLQRLSTMAELYDGFTKCV